VAPFSDLPTMLAGYRISGYVPVLGPFRVSASLSGWIQGFVWERWPTAERVARIVRNAGDRRLRLSLVHAWDDWDIPSAESGKIFRAAANATVAEGLDDATFESWREVRTQRRGAGGFVTTWKTEGDVVLRHEQSPHGGLCHFLFLIGLLLTDCRS
jgi:abhydrolase domain-containing protein 12